MLSLMALGRGRRVGLDGVSGGFGRSLNDKVEQGWVQTYVRYDRRRKWRPINLTMEGDLDQSGKRWDMQARLEGR